MSDQTIIQFRHDLHRHPELSDREAGTSRRVAELIAGFGPDEILEDIGGHGLLASWDFGAGGPVIAIRCELDGLDPGRVERETGGRQCPGTVPGFEITQLTRNGLCSGQ